MGKAVLVTLAALIFAAPAQASFPGRNGKLAVTFQACENQTYVRALTTSGRDLGALVPCVKGTVDAPGPDVYAPDWSADGTRLLFTQGTEIATVAADGSDRRTVFPAAPSLFSSYEGASLAPDGRHVVFTRGGSLYTAALDGSELRRLLPVRRCKGGSGYCVVYRGPRWSPDGRTIAVQRDGPDTRALLVNPSTGKVRRTLMKGSPFELDWSPDSRLLVFRTHYQQDEVKGGASGGNIYVVRADGKGKPRRIVHRKRVAETQPTWAPDGKSIAWIALGFGAGDVSFDVRPSLWRMTLSGGQPRKIRNLPPPYVEEGDYLPPQLAWQPLP